MDAFNRAAAASPPDAPLYRRAHRNLARIAEGRLDLDEAARHHGLAGDELRAASLAEVAERFTAALEERRALLERVAKLQRLQRELASINDPGAAALTPEITQARAQAAAIEENLKEVRLALATAPVLCGEPT